MGEALDDVLHDDHGEERTTLSTEVLDEYGLPMLPIPKALGEVVVELRDIRKSYDLEGRNEQVHALKSISLCIGKEFYPIRRSVGD
jgi:hypothetical protein